MYSKRVLEESGLVETDKDALGQRQYIGTAEAWELADRLNEKENEIVRKAKKKYIEKKDEQQEDEPLYRDERNTLRQTNEK